MDQDGRRSWGYKTIRLSQLISFAGRQNTTVKIFSPYVILNKPRTNAKGIDENTMADSDDDDDDDDNDGWPKV